jgi:hypothetical protein
MKWQLKERWGGERKSKVNALRFFWSVRTIEFIERPHFSNLPLNIKKKIQRLKSLSYNIIIRKRYTKRDVLHRRGIP